MFLISKLSINELNLNLTHQDLRLNHWAGNTSLVVREGVWIPFVVFRLRLIWPKIFVGYIHVQFINYNFLRWFTSWITLLASWRDWIDSVQTFIASSHWFVNFQKKTFQMRAEHSEHCQFVELNIISNCLPGPNSYSQCSAGVWS